jgi:hypothetical protein
MGEVSCSCFETASEEKSYFYVYLSMRPRIKTTYKLLLKQEFESWYEVMDLYSRSSLRPIFNSIRRSHDPNKSIVEDEIADSPRAHY